MDTSHWQKQTTDKPLFPNLLWGRPESRQAAGKLLIIGGNKYGLAAAGEAFAAADKAGAGSCRVLLPDALRPMIGATLDTAEYAPSTPSGSFSQSALDDFMMHSAWADGVLLAGDLGRNSETAIVLEKFVQTWQGILVITKDAADYFVQSPQVLLHHPQTTLVLSMGQLQKLAASARFPQPFTFGMDLIRLVEALHTFTELYQVQIVVKYLTLLVAASNGRVCTMKLSKDIDIWRVRIAAYASVWLLQNPGRPFEALATALYEATAA